MNEGVEAFVVHVNSGSKRSMIIHSAQEAHMALLLSKEVTVPMEYADFADIYSKKLAEMLPERTSINEYTVKSDDSKKSIYGLIYNLDPVNLETLET